MFFSSVFVTLAVSNIKTMFPSLFFLLSSWSIRAMAIVLIIRQYSVTGTLLYSYLLLYRITVAPARHYTKMSFVAYLD